MSCHLKKCASITNIKSVKNALTISEDATQPDEYSVETWNNSWDLEDQTEDKSHEAGNLKLEGHSWLQDCLSSLSSEADVLALAYNQHAVFFASKWDVSEESNTKLKFVSSFEGKLAVESGETITSILCLPLASQKRSLQGGPDWTCIIVGFSSGFVRIYTEAADLLLAQKLHEESVTHLRCKSHVPLRFSNYSDQPDELVIVFTSVVVTIDGFGLLQSLRACRNQIARAAAGRQEVVQTPPLAYKKWGFQEHEKLLDCEAAGVISGTLFDHLVTESIRKGFYGTVKANVPPNSLLMTTGSNPYVGFYHASEGSSQLLLTDVVQAVATKLMNFISSYNAGNIVGGFMGFNQPKENAQPKIEPATALPLRFGLYDKRRQGVSIVLSPNKCLAAITDAFGRVILFDIFKGVAVRMWKGYRDAQCGWVEVEDEITPKETSSFEPKRKRRVFFLVIYAPRRGILEVWCTQQGPRVAAFNVGKTGRLLSPGNAVVGGNFSSGGHSKDSLNSCFFLDTDGILKKVVVPFHLVLSEKNSKRARDLHLLRELKITLKNTTKGKAFEIIKILRDMRTSTIRIQALENILSNRHSTVELVEEVVGALFLYLQKQDVSQTDHEMKLLKQSCVRAQQLVKLYAIVNQINLKPVPAAQAESPLDIQMYANSLCISEMEVGRILSLVTLHQTVVPVLKRHVRFTDDSVTEMTFSEFVSCFVVCDSHLVKSGEETLLHNLPVNLQPKFSEKQVEDLGGFLFHSSIQVGACFSTLQVALKESGIIPDKLLLLLLKHWVSDAGFCPCADKWINLQQVMKHISSLSDPKRVISDSDHVSPWWKSVRETLFKATGNVAAFIGAVVARSVSVIMSTSFTVEQKKVSQDKKTKNNDKDSEESGDSDWESVSLDLEHWNLLVKQLEDVLMLNILLKSQPYGKASVKDVNMSIEAILSGGQGSVTDLVAVWSVSVNLEPEILSYFLNETNGDNNPIPEKFTNEKTDAHSLHNVKGLLTEVRRKFPHSLNHDVLLANCGWEHVMQWSKNKDSVTHLQHAVACLNLIGSSVIKNGYASMMWKTCALKTFESLALLMDKVGKTPKERLCKKELEMTDAHLENFLHFCSQLLNIILETNMASEVEDVPKFSTESFWQGYDSQCPTPLIAMALGQKATNNRQVYIHLTLSSVLHLIVTFQLRNTKPMSLFSALLRKNFFRELHHHVSQTEKEDITLQTARMQFLLRATSAVAQGVPECVPDTASTTLSSPSSYSMVSKWFSSILDLGRGWELDLDEVRRHYVCELHSGGHDIFAQEVMSAVSNQALLGSQLLLLLGQRLYKVIFDCADPTSRVGCLTPDLSNFLKSLAEVPLRCNNVPLRLSANLVDQIISFVSDMQQEHKLAVSMKDTIQDLLTNYQDIS